MREFIAVIAGLIALLGMVPYIIDTIKGKTKPNIVSWFTWTLLTSIGAVAAWSQGAYSTAIFSAASAISTLSIVVLGIKGGVKRYTLFDVLCQGFALIGVVLWQITRQPDIAVIIVVITDLIAALPTLRHSWKAPDAETWQAFAAASGGALLTLLTVSQLTITALAYPIYLVIVNAVVVVVILGRRKHIL